MKFIEKKREPKVFTDWMAQENNNWQPSYNNLSSEAKEALKDALMDEQGFLCCYCERRLTNKDSHIEHFKPQRDPMVDPLDFSNMLCSCQGRLDKGEPRHCGSLKGDWFDEMLLVSPFDFVCEDRFAFSDDGNIRPASPTDAAALETIARLGLDVPKLVALRKSALDLFIDDSLTTDELGRFVSGYLEMDDDGCYGVFWTTIQYLYSGYTTA